MATNLVEAAGVTAESAQPLSSFLLFCTHPRSMFAAVERAQLEAQSALYKREAEAAKVAAEKAAVEREGSLEKQVAELEAKILRTRAVAMAAAVAGR